MTIEKELYARSESQCELCAATEHLGIYEIPPIEKADTAMYYSKLTGRNKCTAYKPGMENEVNLLKQSAK